MSNVVVAAECPSCAAKLDFAAGSNAITCRHCGSKLLVTGRKQTLWYYIPPRLDGRRAVAVATKGQRDAGKQVLRSRNAELLFIPYYRLTGQDLRWEMPPPPPPKEELSDVLYGEEPEEGDVWTREFPDINLSSVVLGPIMSAAGGLLNRIVGMTFAGGRPPGLDEEDAPACRKEITREVHAPKPAVPDVRLRKSSRYERGGLVIHDRYIEKSFIACDLKGTDMYSLGLRQSVLRLELFHHETVRALGRIMSPTIDPQAAEELGIRSAADTSVLARHVIGKVLSLVYFPYWFVSLQMPGGDAITIVDAVSQRVCRTDASPAILEALRDTPSCQPETAGLRPLVCPNCGWDLPVRPDDCIFFCSSCLKAWQISGQEFSEVPYSVFRGSPDTLKADQRHLPFWVLRSGGGKDTLPRFMVPAFRYRRLRVLVELAIRMSAGAHDYETAEKAEDQLTGCYYDVDDAETLARFTDNAFLEGTAEDLRSSRREAPVFAGGTLAWIPFAVNGSYLVAPFGNSTFPVNLLL